MEHALQYSNVEEIETNIPNDMNCSKEEPMDEDMPVGPVNVSADEAPAPLLPPNEEIHSKESNNPSNEHVPSLTNNQLSYSAAAAAAAASYMQYDPSMMSHAHNYSYMTANNYATHDYVSFYNNQQRMAAGGSYATAYNPYQGYNHYPYTTTSMQQMYDGRNMSAYTNANYAQQMLPQNPPLPPGQPIATNTFNPPLPTDYHASTFPTTATVAIAPAAPSVDGEESGTSDRNVTSDNAVPESYATVQNKEPEDDAEEMTAQHASDSSNLTTDAVEQAVDNVDRKSITDHRAAAENALSEDINRYVY